MALEVSSREIRSGVVVVAPVGSIDSDTDVLLEQHLEPFLSGAPPDVAFDMAGVDYLSSGGVRVILKTKKSLMKDGRKMILVNMQPQIEKVFEIINALPTLNVFSSVQELDDYLDTIQRKVMETGEEAGSHYTTLPRAKMRALMSKSRCPGQLLLPFKDVFRGPPYRRDSSGVDIVRVSTEADLESIRTLFLEYARALDFDLNFQHFDAEMATLPGRYVLPRGMLLLASEGRDAAGCVALRRLRPEIGEMKRLYVRPRYRGLGVGKRLARAVMEEASKIGYRKIRLDTVPGMERAMALYRDLGFTPIGAYCHNPVPGALFFECSLGAQKRI